MMVWVCGTGAPMHSCLIYLLAAVEGCRQKTTCPRSNAWHMCVIIRSVALSMSFALLHPPRFPWVHCSRGFSGLTRVGWCDLLHKNVHTRYLCLPIPLVCTSLALPACIRRSSTWRCLSSRPVRRWRPVASRSRVRVSCTAMRAAALSLQVPVTALTATHSSSPSQPCPALCWRAAWPCPRGEMLKELECAALPALCRNCVGDWAGALVSDADSWRSTASVQRCCLGLRVCRGHRRICSNAIGRQRCASWPAGRSARACCTDLRCWILVLHRSRSSSE